jgi:ElaB/YqjD/DUF883 family membrane-anchored ribosome-binding protein
MADRSDSSPSIIGQNEAAGEAHSTVGSGADRAGNVVAEFVEAARSAAESLLEEQKRQVADRVSGVAEALRSAVAPLERSQNRIVARYLEGAADQVDDLSRTMRTRRWNELVADTEEFARRQPTLFVLGAVAAGFLAGRLFWASASGQQRNRDPSRPPASAEATFAVTAAVSSGSRTGAAGLSGDAARPPGAVEAR